MTRRIKTQLKPNYLTADMTSTKIKLIDEFILDKYKQWLTVAELTDAGSKMPGLKCSIRKSTFLKLAQMVSYVKKPTKALYVRRYIVQDQPVVLQLEFNYRWHERQSVQITLVDEYPLHGRKFNEKGHLISEDDGSTHNHFYGKRIATAEVI